MIYENVFGKAKKENWKVCVFFPIYSVFIYIYFLFIFETHDPSSYKNDTTNGNRCKEAKWVANGRNLILWDVVFETVNFPLYQAFVELLPRLTLKRSSKTALILFYEAENLFSMTFMRYLLVIYTLTLSKKSIV